MVSTRRSTKQQDHAPSTPTPKQSATKKKNKVNPIRPLKSPELRKQPKESATADVDDGNQSDVSSTSSRPGIPYHLQKQLAKDIEKAGGIKTFKKGNQSQSLAALCDKRTDLFGKRGSVLRRKIINKVYRWEILNRDGLYTDKILNKFSVKSAATLRSEKKGSKAPTSESELSSSAEEDSDGDSSESSDSDSDSSSHSPKPPPRKKLPKAKKKEATSHPPIVAAELPEAKKTAPKPNTYNMSLPSPTKPLPLHTRKYH